MKRGRRKFPPNSLRNLDKTSAENFLSFLRQTRQFRITLFLGSGVSASAVADGTFVQNVRNDLEVVVA